MKIITTCVFALLLGLIPLDVRGVEYTIQDLGTVGSESSVAYEINNQNAVVGKITDEGKTTTFIWDQDKGLTLLPHQTTKDKKPLINNLSQVVDIYWHQTNYWLFGTSKYKQICLVDADGSTQNIPLPDHWDANKLNRSYQTDFNFWDNQKLRIVGFNDQQQILLSNYSSFFTTLGSDRENALWQNGTYKMIDTSIIYHALGMNNDGVILGWKLLNVENKFTYLLVLYNPNDESTVELLRTESIHEAIYLQAKVNDRGQVIIARPMIEAMRIEGYLWEPETGLVVFEDFNPIHFNNNNQIIGLSTSASQQSQKMNIYMWTPEGKISLDQLADKIHLINDFNDNGYMAAQAIFEGKKHAAVLIPH